MAMFGWDSDAPEPLSGETLAPLEKKTELPFWPLYVSRKGVAKWN